jgi:hypothetical protein
VAVRSSTRYSARPNSRPTCRAWSTRTRVQAASC